jgi:hypothetical protein
MELFDKKYIEYLIAPFAIVGAYPLVAEINDSTKPFFSENYIKWVVIWSLFYSKTSDIMYSTAVSVLIMIMFPKIFFGKKTYYK